MLQQKREDRDRERGNAEHHGEVIDEEMRVGPGHDRRELIGAGNWRNSCPRKLTLDMPMLLCGGA